MWNVAHLHIAINHIPVVLVPAALVLLAVGVWRRSESVFRAGIVVAWVGVASGLATYLTGDAAADLVMAVEKAQEKTLDPIVGEHDASAGWALGSAVLVAAAGVWAWRRKGLGREVTVPLLVLTALSTAILARTALLGGRIRHPEARAGFVAPSVHDEHEKH
ncbi:MAG TPA: DUF2231 domain-containing protein [Gemmatimonadales bacterium]|jgi:uncharacterized membrane protein|nr:DUF2231 domain-containing protein [Gemmatimonadales bacterium]